MLRNKKGQALILFVILLPLMLMFMAFVVDTGIMFNKKLVLKNLIKNETNIDEIENKLKINKVSYKKIYEKDNCVIVESDVKAVFGKIINKSKYEIIIKKCE